jgi:hypothetical protein
MKKAKLIKDLYFHREVVCYSREKRPMELITLTTQSKQSDFKEELIDGIFPEADGDET